MAQQTTAPPRGSPHPQRIQNSRSGHSAACAEPPRLDLQASLFDAAAMAEAPRGPRPIPHSDFRPTAPRRHALSHGAWIDHQPSWLKDADERFFDLSRAAAWRNERRQMYERVVDVPRLVAYYRDSDSYPATWLTRVVDELNRHYLARPEIQPRDRLVSAGMCLYRDGRDSVAWHGDRLGRGRHEDTIIAIVSLGSPRALRLRPNGGGETVSFELGHGDLLVMGGSCQRTYEHCVPKTNRAVGPRISVQFRPSGVA